MISALKKLTSPQSRSSGDNSHASPSQPSCHQNGIHALPDALQKKFGRGVNYNMKLLLRGDRASGKSALFQRLQGKPFPESDMYAATEEIQVAAIQWNHKATDDIIKVEVWDVVDKGKKRIRLEGLKIQQEGASEQSQQQQGGVEAALDAEFVDVYKGAHGVVLLFDVTKQWTFDYVTREAAKVPKGLPVLVLGNFMDKYHHRCITRDQAVSFVEELSRSTGMDIRYSESSMRNGFGLRFLHKFLSLPYLSLQRETLLRQVESNERELEGTRQELDLYFQSEESDYDSFSEGMNKTRRRQADRMAPAPTVDVVVGQGQGIVLPQNNNASTTMSASVEPPMALGRGYGSGQGPAVAQLKGSETVAKTNNTAAANSSAASFTQQGEERHDENVRNANTTSTSDKSADVEDFVPESSGIIDFFLNEGESPKSSASAAAAVKTDHHADRTDGGQKKASSLPQAAAAGAAAKIAVGEEDASSDDESGGGGGRGGANPMVASITEDIDLDDLERSPASKVDYEEL